MLVHNLFSFIFRDDWFDNLHFALKNDGSLKQYTESLSQPGNRIDI